MKKLLLILTLLLNLGYASAQTFSINLDQTTNGWSTCIEPKCNPGGNTKGPTTTTIKETGAVWPSNSLEISMVGPNYTNLLVYENVGATNSTYFNSDFYAMPSVYSKANLQAVEYDIYFYQAPYRFMFGSQCVTGGDWDIWNALEGAWVDTKVKCVLFNYGEFNHIQWFVHRVVGDTSCSGYPCEHYDMLGVNGVYTELNLTEPSQALPKGWSNASGLNFQLDLNGTWSGNKTVTEYLKGVNLVQF